MVQVTLRTASLLLATSLTVCTTCRWPIQSSKRTPDLRNRWSRPCADRPHCSVILLTCSLLRIRLARHSRTGQSSELLGTISDPSSNLPFGDTRGSRPKKFSVKRHKLGRLHPLTTPFPEVTNPRPLLTSWPVAQTVKLFPGLLPFLGSRSIQKTITEIRWSPSDSPRLVFRGTYVTRPLGIKQSLELTLIRNAFVSAQTTRYPLRIRFGKPILL